MEQNSINEAPENEEMKSTSIMQQTVPDWDLVNERLSETVHLLNELSGQFKDRFSYDERQEKLVDSMHAELQKYRNDMYAMLLRPLLVDIIEVVDNIRKAGNAFAKKGSAEKKASGIITDFILDLHNVLDSYGVVVYKGTPGDTYTPIQQRIVTTIVTNNPELNGKVAESLGFGYSYKGKVIWAEKVKTYKYQINTD